MSSLTGKHILCAPAHHLLDDGLVGSEPLITAGIVLQAARHFERVTAVCGKVGELRRPDNLNIIEVGSVGGDFFRPSSTLRFMARYFIAGLRVLRTEAIDLLHHVLPYSLNVTYNPLTAMASVPYVVGPVQQTYANWGDEAPLGRGGSGEGQRNVLGPFKFASNAVGAVSHHMLRRAAHVVAMTDDEAAKASKVVDDARISVISPGIDASRWPFALRRRKPEDPLKVVTVSYLVARKAVHEVIEAVAIANKRGARVELTIVGNGPESQALHRYVETLELQNIVCFTGYVAHRDLGKYLQKAHLFVSMSKEEIFGMNMLEALASGLPVVSAANAGAIGILSRGGIGRLVPISDSAALADALLSYARSAVALTEESQRARITAETVYSWTRIGDAYAAVYEAALSNGRQRSDI